MPDLDKSLPNEKRLLLALTNPAPPSLLLNYILLLALEFQQRYSYTLFINSVFVKSPSVLRVQLTSMFTVWVIKFQH